MSAADESDMSRDIESQLSLILPADITSTDEISPEDVDLSPLDGDPPLEYFSAARSDSGYGSEECSYADANQATIHALKSIRKSCWICFFKDRLSTNNNNNIPVEKLLSPVFISSGNEKWIISSPSLGQRFIKVPRATLLRLRDLMVVNSNHTPESSNKAWTISMECQRAWSYIGRTRQVFKIQMVDFEDLTSILTESMITFGRLNISDLKDFTFQLSLLKRSPPGTITGFQPSLTWERSEPNYFEDLWPCGLKLQPGPVERFSASITQMVPSKKVVSMFSFRFQWDLASFLASEYNGNKHLGLGEIITITGTSDQAQAATCATYLHQLWPCMGPEILCVIQDAFRAHNDNQDVIASRCMGSTSCELR